MKGTPTPPKTYEAFIQRYPKIARAWEELAEASGSGARKAVCRPGTAGRWSSTPASRGAGDYADLLPGLLPVENLPFGALVGVVEVVDCVPLAEVDGDPFAVGPWCWVLTGARRCRPVPFTGLVGLFSVPDQLVEAPGLCRNAQGAGQGPSLN